MTSTIIQSAANTTLTQIGQFSSLSVPMGNNTTSGSTLFVAFTMSSPSTPTISGGGSAWIKLMDTTTNGDLGFAFISYNVNVGTNSITINNGANTTITAFVAEIAGLNNNGASFISTYINNPANTTSTAEGTSLTTTVPNAMLIYIAWSYDTTNSLLANIGFTGFNGLGFSTPAGNIPNNAEGDFLFGMFKNINNAGVWPAFANYAATPTIETTIMAIALEDSSGSGVTNTALALLQLLEMN